MTSINSFFKQLNRRIIIQLFPLTNPRIISSSKYIVLTTVFNIFNISYQGLRNII